MANQPQPNRSRFERTRTGCLTCRRRRKKCDELKPVCKACERNNFECTWPEASIKAAHRQNQCGLQHHDADATSSDTSGSSISSGLEDLTQLSFTEVNAERAIECGELVHDFFIESPGLDKRRYNGYPVDVPMRLGKMPSRADSSQLLLQHYLEKTADVLGATPGGAQNPFVTRVIPLAFVDDLVMSSVLALSGVHLDSEQGSSSHIKNTTWHHYAYIIRSLKDAFSDISSCNASQALRILVVLIMLCHIEAISGNSESAVFAHLRAGRQLVIQLNARDADARASDKDYQVLRSFICETYAYIVLTSNITPYGLVEDRIIPVDPFIGSLAALKDGEVSGSFLSCGFKLFEMIPRISLLARTRLAEQITNSCTAESQATYEELHTKLSEWKSPRPHVSMMAWADEHMWAGEIYRNTLLVYLMVGMYPCPADRMGMIQDEIQQKIDIAVSLLISIANSPFEAIMLWPITIIGSCLLREDQRELVRKGVKDTRWGQLKNVGRAINLLELVWADTDDYVYGPYGLYLMMKKHDINPSIF